MGDYLFRSGWFWGWGWVFGVEDIHNKKNSWCQVFWVPGWPIATHSNTTWMGKPSTNWLVNFPASHARVCQSLPVLCLAGFSRLGLLGVRVIADIADVAPKLDSLHQKFAALLLLLLILVSKLNMIMLGFTMAQVRCDPAFSSSSSFPFEHPSWTISLIIEHHIPLEWFPPNGYMRI